MQFLRINTISTPSNHNQRLETQLLSSELREGNTIICSAIVQYVLLSLLLLQLYENSPVTGWGVGYAHKYCSAHIIVFHKNLHFQAVMGGRTIRSYLLPFSPSSCCKAAKSGAGGPEPRWVGTVWCSDCWHPARFLSLLGLEFLAR